MRVVCRVLYCDCERHAIVRVSDRSALGVFVEKEGDETLLRVLLFDRVMQGKSSIDVANSRPEGKCRVEALDHAQVGHIGKACIVNRKTSDTTSGAGRFWVVCDQITHDLERRLLTIDGDMEGKPPAAISAVQRLGLSVGEVLDGLHPRIVPIHCHMQRQPPKLVLYRRSIRLRVRQHAQGVAAQPIESHDLVH